MNETKSGATGPIVIKKYANRRLYNTHTSSYVTLDHLCEMVKEGVEFEVRDARTGEDITRQVLAQIIFDEENKGQHLLPLQFLRQLIRFYGDSLQAFVPSYLEMSMESFTKNQHEMRQKFTDALGGKLGYKDFEQLCSRPSPPKAHGAPTRRCRTRSRRSEPAPRAPGSLMALPNPLLPRRRRVRMKSAT